MSFKRDGNDSGLLSILQRRRIKDLLGENIPEDEAKLLSNGRFACLVCTSNPIFDTVAMLCVHRKGKKHKASAEFQEKKKEELKQLIIKRKHEQFVNTGSTSITVAHPYHHTGISTSSPYDSRTRKIHKAKLGDRKTCVDLQQNVNSNTGSSVSFSHLDSDYSYNKTPLNKYRTDPPSSCPPSTPWHQVCEAQTQSGFMKHDAQLKNIFSKSISKDVPIRLHPYTPKCRKKTVSISNKHSCNEKVPVSLSSYKLCAKQTPNLNMACSQKDNDSDSSLHHAPNYDQVVSHSNHNKNEQDNFNMSPPSSCTMSIPTLSSQTFSRAHLLPPPPPPPPPPDSALSSSTLQKDSTVVHPSGSHSHPSSKPTQDKSLALKYRHLQGSGWKRDWDGKWIKDEEAEFDSDEEAPDIP